MKTLRLMCVLEALALSPFAVASESANGLALDAAEEVDFLAKIESMMDRTMQRRLAEQEARFEEQRAKDRAEYERALSILEQQNAESKRTLSALASKVPGGDDAIKEEADSAERRRLAAAGKAVSGLWVKTADAGIIMGEGQDVKFVRSGPSAATMHNDLTVNGTVKVGADGDVEIRSSGVGEATVSGQVNFTNIVYGAAQSSAAVPLRVCVGHSKHTDWLQYSTGTNIYQSVSIADCGFTQTPEIFTSLSGRSSHWTVTGVTSIYSESKDGFRIYIHHDTSDAGALAASHDWSINWVAFGV